MTRDEFFQSYEQFLEVFQNREPGRLRRYDKAAGTRPPSGCIVPSKRRRNVNKEWQNFHPDSFQTSQSDATKGRGRLRTDQKRRRTTDKSRTNAAMATELTWSLTAMKREHTEEEADRIFHCMEQAIHRCTR
ncbi:hypothetical protein C8R46DRAFT_1209880 [Mycena filopes]|nr:hypothetical protein C8R46DRAFT_1209880 [Mycena filopes]